MFRCMGIALGAPSSEISSSSELAKLGLEANEIPRSWLFVDQGHRLLVDFFVSDVFWVLGGSFASLCEFSFTPYANAPAPLRWSRGHSAATSFYSQGHRLLFSIAQIRPVRLIMAMWNEKACGNESTP